MAIWTSRYSNKELVENKDKYYCVGISLGTPKFPLGYTVEQQCYSLAPKGYMLRMELEKFTEEYYRKLEGIGNDKIIDMVMRFEKTAADEGKDLVLLCYEDVRIPEDWCHRTVFAQWYCEMTGEIIEELPDPNPPKVKKPPVQKQAKKEESKRTAAQKEAKMETEGYEQMSLFGIISGTGERITFLFQRKVPVHCRVPVQKQRHRIRRQER